MPYGHRVTVCISSQVGCAVGCAFCATGAMGFRRNLSTAEIVDQMRAAAGASETGQRITNVVYMGMGEPLLNLGAVLDSIRVLTAPLGLGLGHRAISVSTVGIPTRHTAVGPRRAAGEPRDLAARRGRRDPGAPYPRRFRHPLAEILEAAWEHFAITGRKLLVEYVLLAGVNDSRRRRAPPGGPSTGACRGGQPLELEPGLPRRGGVASRPRRETARGRRCAVGASTLHHPPRLPRSARLCGRPISRPSSGRAKEPASRRHAASWPAPSSRTERIKTASLP